MISHIGTNITVTPYPEHTHACHEITYVRKGEGIMYACGQEIPFTAGTIFVIPPKTIHRLWSANGHVATSMLSHFESLAPVRRVVSFQDNEHKDGLAIIDIMCRNNLSHDEFLQKLGASLCIFILRNLNIDKSVEEHICAVDNIIDEINMRLSEFDLDVNDILNRSGYAHNYIRQIFKQTTGYSPTKYLNKVRISQAMSMLAFYKKDHKISDIATRSGFLDLAYFSKAFKKATGLSPREYQQKYARDDEYDKKMMRTSPVEQFMLKESD